MGVVLCIVGVIPLLVCTTIFGDTAFFCITCVNVLLIFVSVSVYKMVNSGMISSSYNVLLQREEYESENKESNKAVKAFTELYWLIITAIYLGISFYNNDWHITWIIWPVAGVLYPAIKAIICLVSK